MRLGAFENSKAYFTTPGINTIQSGNINSELMLGGNHLCLRYDKPVRDIVRDTVRIKIPYNTNLYPSRIAIYCDICGMSRHHDIGIRLCTQCQVKQVQRLIATTSGKDERK